MADRRDHPAHTTEAEPVKVTITSGLAVLELDDGVLLGFDAEDLRAALTDTSAHSSDSGGAS